MMTSAAGKRSSGNSTGSAFKSWAARGLAPLASEDRPVILRYHRVTPDGQRPFYDLGVPSRLFSLHLDWLARHRNFVTLDQVVAWMSGAAALPPRAVALTFDDGYRDNLTEALPALLAHGAPATVFLVSHLIEERLWPWWDQLAFAVEQTEATSARIRMDGAEGVLSLGAWSQRRRSFDWLREQLKRLPDPRRLEALEALQETLGVGPPPRARCPLLSWEEVRRMRDAGVRFGSHTRRHPVLTRLPLEEAVREIVESKSLIERRLEAPVRHFSYPNGKRGDFSPAIEEAVEAAGYCSAVTTIEGPLGSRDRITALPRKGVSPGVLVDATGRFSGDLLKTELSGLFDALFLRRWRDRRIH